MLRTPDGRLHEVLFRHGQTAQDASLFLSTEYGFIGLEEVAPAYLPGKDQTVSPGISEEVFNMAYSRLRQEGLPSPEIALTSNPPSRLHWSSKRIIDATADEKHGVLRFDIPGGPPVTWEHWFTPISENKQNLRPGYYEELTATWPRILVRRFVEGERVDVFVGIPRFDLDKLDQMSRRAIEPPFRGFLRDTDDNVLHVKLEANPQGWVRIWSPPIPNHQYVIGADPAMGVPDGDYSSAHVLDRKDLSIVATFHGRIGPEAFGAEELPRLGRMYGNALIGVESNNTGGGAATLALKYSGYPQIFYEHNLRSRGRTEEKIGWSTTRSSKALLIDGLADWLDAGGEIVDAETISELQTFGIDESGKMQAQTGCHDDKVISLSLAIQMNQWSGLETIYSGLNSRG
jgi:hypothetical protein